MRQIRMIWSWAGSGATMTRSSGQADDRANKDGQGNSQGLGADHGGTDNVPEGNATRGLCGLVEQWRGGIRAFTAATPRDPTEPARTPHVVVVPGLGALRYLVPLVREFARRGHRVTLLDLPGFGRRDGLGCLPTIQAIAEATAWWCANLEDGDQPVLFGHSTGAQAALRAAVRLQEDERPPAALVLAGPTIAPNQRSLPRLLGVPRFFGATPILRRRDSPAELGVLGDCHRGGRDVLTLLRSALADRPERTVRELTVPLVVTAGRHDAFAPAGWLVALTHAAPSRSTRVVRLPGSHNNPFTHTVALATVVETVAANGSVTCALPKTT